MARQHVLGGALAGLAFAQVTMANAPPDAAPNALLTAAVVGVVAASTATLPDICQHRAWRTADAVLPDEALGHGGPLQHRGISHWWGVLYLAAAVLVPTGPWPDPGSHLRGYDLPWAAACALLAALTHRAPRLLRVLGMAAVLAVTGGWLVSLHPAGLQQAAAVGALAGCWSHLVLDWWFGKRCRSRAEGVPLMPWWAHAGLGGDVDSWQERWVGRPVLLAGIAAMCVVIVAGAA
jgi:hypothetical protein